MTFTPTPWASQQKSRVATIVVPPGEKRILDLYERAAAHLPARIVPRTVRESTGRGRQRTVAERQESFRADSIVRPLVAENLALGRQWYAGFAKLMTKLNPATGNPYRNQLPFERGGLNAMISDPQMWDDEGEALVVKAVHEAIRNPWAGSRGRPMGRAARSLRRRPRIAGRNSRRPFVSHSPGRRPRTTPGMRYVTSLAGPAEFPH